VGLRLQSDDHTGGYYMDEAERLLQSQYVVPPMTLMRGVSAQKSDSCCAGVTLTILGKFATIRRRDNSICANLADHVYRF
jgi:hypothetical protein